MHPPGGFLTRWLRGTGAAVLPLYAVAAAFAAYFSMYAFRKPLAAASFEGEVIFDSSMRLKTALILSQITGYALSKFLGIKVCSESTRSNRLRLLVGLILLAGLGLLLFAVLPGQWKLLAMFINGIPLGMVWGLVVRYLEGRGSSEFLLAGLSASYIISSGIVKDVGLQFLSQGVPEVWMPLGVAVLFLPLYLLSVWLLHQLPGPSPREVAARTERPSLSHEGRRTFLRRYGPGLWPLLIGFFFLTAFRDFRDNYGIELFSELGYKEAALFSRAELGVTLGVLAALGALSLFRNHRSGLIGTYVIILAGFLLIGTSTLLLDQGMLSGFTWIVLSGLGCFLAYVPFGAILFERLIAYLRFSGTAVFAIYLADALGYTGAVGIQVYRDLGTPAVSYLSFLRWFSYALSVGGCLLILSSAVYFLKTSRKTVPSTDPEPALTS